MLTASRDLRRIRWILIVGTVVLSGVAALLFGHLTDSISSLPAASAVSEAAEIDRVHVVPDDPSGDGVVQQVVDLLSGCAALIVALGVAFLFVAIRRNDDLSRVATQLKGAVGTLRGVDDSTARVLELTQLGIARI
ncbi:MULTISPECIES: hypothetical protein [unclassified Agreia]|uniref:hypothetical protein n=1 Tax=unclassified Agreia TaxID=2641148 RepID=UPI0006FEF393|nr:MULTISPECIES: hypothetical protein [unclassified Agreia]KQM59264.1 hypothetical protein ASE64_07660 [Agreia sp. Leaf210]KQO09913.1 hypothetical protein ASF06_06610 [Agreia sp. Leaf244]